MTIPKGKRILIASQGSDILPNNILTLDTEVSLSLQSHFDALIGNQDMNKAMTALTGAIKNLSGYTISGSTKEMGYQIWTGTDPVSFSFTTTLNMKVSGKSDVLEPAVALMKLVLPTEPTKGKGFGLAPPGPDIISAIKSDFNSGYAKYSFRCGIIYLPNVVFTKVEPTFSDDLDSLGYPIWCTLQIDVSSLFTATNTFADGLLSNGASW
jgi:hypothetical protein